MKGAQSELKIKVKDVKEFMTRNRALYALRRGKRFEVRLRAGPNVKRYIVTTAEGEKEFTKLGEAVKHFNANQLADMMEVEA